MRHPVAHLQRQWIDAREFERLAKEADQLEDENATDTLRVALGLYGGEFCAETYYPWAEAIQER